MSSKYVYITVPFLAVVFFSFLYEFIYNGPVYCWMLCLPPEISCLTTVSYTFGLVPATTLAASSAVSGCLAAFDICELSCAKKSNLVPYSLTGGDISSSCMVFRNHTRIQAKQITWELANPFNLDADCLRMPETTSTVPPSTTRITAIPPQVGFNTTAPPSTTRTDTPPNFGIQGHPSENAAQFEAHSAVHKMKRRHIPF